MDNVTWLIRYLCNCLSFCLLCFISVQGEQCSSEIAELLQHENWISLNDSESYCFVNDCTIRLKESNVLLSIINKTTDWITATNSTDLFTLVLVNSGYCSLEDPKIGYFIFIVVISFIIVSSSSLNTVLHLTIKELRTTPGRGVRHLLKSCTRFRNQLDFQLISDFKLDFSDFQAPEINGDLAKMLV